MANTSTASVSAILAGRARSAHCGMTSAKFQTAMATGTVSAGSARACEDTRENTAKKVAHQISNCFPFPVVTGVCIFNLRKLQFKNRTAIEGGRSFSWFMFLFFCTTMNAIVSQGLLALLFVNLSVRSHVKTERRTRCDINNLN